MAVPSMHVLAGKQPVASGPLVSDSFDRADNASSMGNADTGQTWVPNDGTWEIKSNKAYLGAGQRSTVVDCGVADVLVSVVVDNFYGGVCLRSTDANNHYLTQGDHLWKKSGGGYTSICSFTAYGAGDTVAVSAVGSNFEVFVNGVSVATGTDSTFLTQTKHGLYLNAGATILARTLEDFSITSA